MSFFFFSSSSSAGASSTTSSDSIGMSPISSSIGMSSAGSAGISSSMPSSWTSSPFTRIAASAARDVSSCIAASRRWTSPLTVSSISARVVIASTDSTEVSWDSYDSNSPTIASCRAATCSSFSSDRLSTCDLIWSTDPPKDS